MKTDFVHLDPCDFQQFTEELSTYIEQVPVSSGVFDLLASARYYIGVMASRCFDFAG